MQSTKSVFCTTLLCLLAAHFAFSQKDEKPKWNVNEPQILNYQSHQFSVSEGTWMNLDVSPDGSTLVFDLLGDIYSMPISGGVARCIRPGIAWEVQPRWSPDGKTLLFTSDAGGGDNIWRMNPDGSEAKQITKEDFRLLNNAVWLPDGEYFIARKHFTSSRSLGAGEMWMYHLSGGAGIQLTKRKNDQQDQNEPSVSPDGRFVYFSEDMYPGGYFQYNKDPNKQIFQIRRFDRETGKIETITGGSGSAFRPQVSPDGRMLAFVRRVRTKTVLFVHLLETGEEYPIYDNLSKDQAEAWTIFGIYPGFSWTPRRDKSLLNMGEIVIWSQGTPMRIAFNLSTQNSAGDTEPKVTATPIRFTCNVETKLAETVRSNHAVFEPYFTAKAIRHAVTSPDGKHLVFHAAGFLYVKKLPNGTPVRMTDGLLTDKKAVQPFESEPTFSPDGKTIAFVSWDDEKTGAIWKTTFNPNGKITAASLVRLTQEKGQYRTPQFSPDGTKIIFRKDDGNDHLGVLHCKKPGIYWMNADGSNMKFISDTGENPRFSTDGSRIFVNTGGYLFGGLDKSLKTFDLNGADERVLFKTKYANQWVPSPDGKWLAFTELHKAYICPMPAAGVAVDLSGDMKSIPVAQVSRDAGYNLHWSADSKRVHWTLGDAYFSTDLTNKFAFLPGAPDSLPAMDTTGVKIGLQLPSFSPSEKQRIVFTNARIITMEGDEVIENGFLMVKGNKIEAVGRMGSTNIPENADTRIIDCTGKTLMPGMIDAHAHSGNFRFGLSPQKQWEYYANLAYGVTTSHDPSANSEMVFTHSEMIKTGAMVGPRLFSTGTILYGAEGDFKAVINSLDDARSALRRTAAWGAFSVKSYNQPRREQRQWVMAAAKEQNILVVPEGGSFFFHNMSMVQDGHTGVEHNIPVAPLHSDVIEFWKRTKTHNTPTLIVCYGGLNGENYWYQNTNVWEKTRLLRFTPRTDVDARSRHVTQAPQEEYDNGHILVSKSCKKLQDAGVNINMGAHGQLQGLGAHWELWMLGQGGMTPHQALRSATYNGALYLGMESELGSLRAGKLADLLVLDKNPLDNLSNSESISYVMVNGRLFNAETLDEIGGAAQKCGKFWFHAPGSQVNGVGNTNTHSRNKSGCVCGH